MGYSKKAAQEVNEFKSKYMPAGINENVRIDKVEMKVSPNGNKMFDITFINDAEQTAVHTEWEPKMAPWMTDKKQLDTNQAKQYLKIYQLLRCYYTDEQINFEGEDFASFAKWVVSMFEMADKSKKLRLKLVYNKDGYTTLPTKIGTFNSPVYYVEPMTTTKEDSKIVIEPTDVLTRPVIADKETTVTNPFTEPTTATATLGTTEDNDQLPF